MAFKPEGLKACLERRNLILEELKKSSPQTVKELRVKLMALGWEVSLGTIRGDLFALDRVKLAEYSDIEGAYLWSAARSSLSGNQTSISAATFNIRTAEDKTHKETKKIRDEIVHPFFLRPLDRTNKKRKTEPPFF